MSSRRPGFTLIELLLVVAIVGILVAWVLPSSQPAIHDQLRSTAHIVATDLAYARSLAIAHNSKYRIDFDLSGNRYVLSHSGVNSALDTLPKTPFSSPGDPADQHIVDLGKLPHAGPTVRLAAVAVVGSATESTDRVEFGPLGETIATDATVVWLTAGGAGDRKYIQLEVNPVTGLSTIGNFSSVGPPAGVTQVN